MPKIYLSNNKAIPLYGNLLKLEQDKLFHEEHIKKLAHPADILAEKLGDLKKKLEAMTCHICDEPITDERISSIASYILEIDSFYDSLFLIIKCLTKPNTTVVDNKDVTIWLRSIKSKCYNDFIGATNERHKIFRDISNKIKHSHMSISPLTIRNHNNIEVHGFYIKTITGEKDQRGPDPEIHRSYNGYATAFSYNHFILCSIECIFHYLEYLNKCLLNNNLTKEHKENNLLGIVENNLLGIVLSCEKITHTFFPDEYSKPYIFIKHQNNSDILISYPYKYRSEKNEIFEKIYGINWHVGCNRRTSSSHEILPYIRLTKRQA